MAIQAQGSPKQIAGISFVSQVPILRNRKGKSSINASQ